VGLSEDDAKKQGRAVKTGKFYNRGLGKAMAVEETAGFVKWIADAQTDQLLGAAAVGPTPPSSSPRPPSRSARVHGRELGRTIHAHPTFGELWMEAAHSLHGEAIHAPPRKNDQNPRYHAGRAVARRRLRKSQGRAGPVPGRMTTALGRVDAAGVCASNLKIIAQGNEHTFINGIDLSQFPAQLGDEGCITIVSAGKNLRGRFPVGKRYCIQPAVDHERSTIASASATTRGHAEGGVGYCLPGHFAQYLLVTEKRSRRAACCRFR